MEKNIYVQDLDGSSLQKLYELNPTSVTVSQESVASTIPLLKNRIGDLKIYCDVKVFADIGPDYAIASAVVDNIGRVINTKNACPSNNAVKKYKLETIKTLLELDINGIWLTELNYPTVWAQPEPELFDTCYCARCLSLFEEKIVEKLQGITVEEKAIEIDGLYYHEWLEFKSDFITNFAKEVRKLINAHNKEMILGVYVIPWKDKDYGAGITRLLGQDFGKLSDFVDMFVPMFFHTALGKEVTWVGGMTDYFWNVGKTFVPAIQVSDNLEKALQFAISNSSSGVSLFTLDELISSNDNLEIVKKFFASN